MPQALRRLPQNSSPATSHSSQTAGEARAYARFASLHPLIVARMTTNPLPSSSRVTADRRVACLGPVPGSTAASAVLIGALADEPPLNTGTPARRPARHARARVVPETVRSTDFAAPVTPTPPANARVQGLPSNSKCYAVCVFRVGRGLWVPAAHFERRAEDVAPLFYLLSPALSQPQLLPSHTRRAQGSGTPKETSHPR